MFCSRCGRLMNKKVTYCTNCGFKLKNAIPDVKGVEKHTANYNESRKSKKFSIGILIFLIPFGVAVYIIGCLLSNWLHLAFHIIAVVGGLLVLFAIKELIVRSKYPPER